MRLLTELKELLDVEGSQRRLSEVLDTADKQGTGGGGASSWNDLKDKPFGDVETVVMHEQEVQFAPMEEMGGLNIALITLDNLPATGTNCTVIFNGEKYICPVRPSGDGFEFGNCAILGDEDTGEPFIIAHAPSDGMTLMALATADTTATVSIKGVKCKQIGLAYAPDAYLLDLTAFDIGTIKRNQGIIAGVPVSVANELETVYKKGVIFVKAELQSDHMGMVYAGVGFSPFGPEVCTFPAFIRKTDEQTFEIQGLIRDHLVAIKVASLSFFANMVRLTFPTE